MPRFDAQRPATGTGGQQVIYLGTGWLIAPNCLITNHHVFNARNAGQEDASETDLRLQATQTVVRFDYSYKGLAGNSVRAIRLLAGNKTLDYALIELEDTVRKPLPLAKKGIIAVDDTSYQPVNIIQHPNGNPTNF